MNYVCRDLKKDKYPMHSSSLSKNGIVIKYEIFLSIFREIQNYCINPYLCISKWLIEWI